jgi:hypothetical protein
MNLGVKGLLLRNRYLNVKLKENLFKKCRFKNIEDEFGV